MTSVNNEYSFRIETSKLGAMVHINEKKPQSLLIYLKMDTNTTQCQWICEIGM